MVDFWNDRYSSVEYAYGTDPNKYLKFWLHKIPPGKILFPAEGEGRNAVYAAGLGFNVFAFDSSEMAREKALNLAMLKKVTIDYRTFNFNDAHYSANDFDVIVLIFVHAPPEQRHAWHRKLLNYLKPGGRLILEGFSKGQLAYNSGGPANLSMLFSQEEMISDFGELKDLTVEQKIVNLDEGEFHNGRASVIRVTGTK